MGGDTSHASAQSEEVIGKEAPPGSRGDEPCSVRIALSFPNASLVHALGEPVEQPQPVHVERLNGVLRDRLACLTRKTHAFAKRPATWDAMVGLALFEHNWLRPHPALRLPSTTSGRCYEPRTPAMAKGLTDHCWSWQEFLTMRVPITS